MNHLIIGGVTRAGTTSLFNYLSDHPEICPATLKETRFFLSHDYPIHRKYFFEQGIENYLEFFSHCDSGCVRLEATPDYLFSAGTAQRIKASLPSVRFIFVLRDPIARLVSWYKFARQNRMILPQTTFVEFMGSQTSYIGSEDSVSAPQHLRALTQGRYSRFMGEYIEAFGSKDILILRTDALSHSPRIVMEQICRFTNIDMTFYRTYQFKVTNESYAVRNTRLHEIQMHGGRRLRMLLHNQRRLRRMMRFLWHSVLPVYRRLNVTKSDEFHLLPETRAFLEEYYARDCELVASLSNCATYSGEALETLLLRN